MDPKWNINSLPEAQRNVFRTNFLNPIYVHSSILDWIQGFLDMFQHIQYEINEIFHHNLDGDLYCIKFSSDCIPLYAIMFDRMDQLRILTRFKMPWKSMPTYFLRIDSKFNKIHDKIMKHIQSMGLMSLLKKTYETEVNFVFIAIIKVYEFSTRLSAVQINQLTKLFGKFSSAKISLYITDEFPWNNLFNDFIDMDTLALDICAEEWIRYDLLNEFEVEDLLKVDLAHKDYRTPYYDSYLDRYLKRLIAKRIPYFNIDSKDKIEFYFSSSIGRMIGNYFIHLYYNRISKIYVQDLITRQEFDYITEIYDVPIEILFSLELNLIGQQPDPDCFAEISPKYKSVKYNISNYEHMTDRVFRRLLNFPNSRQKYIFDLGTEFIFDVSFDDVDFLSMPINSSKDINITVKNCANRNAVDYDKFVKYLIKLFGRLTENCPKCDLTIKFLQCNVAYNYLDPIFMNILKTFKSVKFDSMDFPCLELRELHLSISANGHTTFYDCDKLQDNDVTLIVTQMIYNDDDGDASTNVIIDGTNSCTYLVYFMIAHFFIVLNGMQPFHAALLPTINSLVNHEMLNRLEFYIDDDNFVGVRDVESKQIMDFYYFVQGIAEDEPPPFEYN